MLLFMSRIGNWRSMLLNISICPMSISRQTEKNETKEMHCGKIWILWYGKQNKTKENKIKKTIKKQKQKTKKIKQSK